MRLNTYILMVILIALIGLCAVHEAMKQTRARYKIGNLLAREEKLMQELAKLKSELAELKSAKRLEQASLQLDDTMTQLSPVLEVELEETAALPNY
ncbi:MAG: hypothetical protein JXR97_05680 [Planctomycetes bacterium]|nr:hypothetical protein [Planctomycetota bacterium]